MRKLLTATLAAAAVAMVGLMGTGCSKYGDKKPQPIAKIACDASFENILEQEIAVYEYIYPKEDVIAYYVDENSAIDSLLDMKGIRTAVVTRMLTPKELKYLKDNRNTVYQKKIAVDAVAVIVNHENPVEILSREELAEILTGKYTRWDQIEPSKLGDINVIFDHQGSSIVNYMRDSVMNGQEFGPNVFAQQSNEEVFNTVAANKNAIGIIGVSWITSDMRSRNASVEELAQVSQASDTTRLDFKTDVKVLKIRGNNEVTAYRPYQANIFDGTYPLHRSIYMITTGTGATTSHRFFSFVTGFQGQKLIQMTGILPATVRPRMVEVE